MNKILFDKACTILEDVDKLLEQKLWISRFQDDTRIQIYGDDEKKTKGFGFELSNRTDYTTKIVTYYLELSNGDFGSVKMELNKEEYTKVSYLFNNFFEKHEVEFIKRFGYSDEKTN